MRFIANPPIICLWRKQINAGDRAPNDSDWHYGGSLTDSKFHRYEDAWVLLEK